MEMIYKQKYWVYNNNHKTIIHFSHLINLT
ncbi:hypothetical protein Sazerac_028 [Staphylococcus phage Sazerac]|uniref:Uncharacterized protein n=1 Tax=Staphylococcus phage HS13 TaxID=3056403 RepID=A0AA49X2X4_9VIRU|nr:hypothetical protein Sazerac_028 [Staphylococcus phage Sazerac]WLJ26036.1 MAG: hypothetical protein [Staphylococcus phage HS13]DAI53267.1 MAG TPA: hypothetical protein [Caudoviricetes sp.]